MQCDAMLTLASWGRAVSLLLLKYTAAQATVTAGCCCCSHLAPGNQQETNKQHLREQTENNEQKDVMGWGCDVPASAGKGEGGRSKMRSLLMNRSAISWLCFKRASRSCTAPRRSSTYIACTSFCQTCSELPAQALVALTPKLAPCDCF